MIPITVTALGTQWLIEIFDPITQLCRDTLIEDISAFLYSVENRLSRFRDDSLIGQLNKNGYIDTDDEDLRALILLGQQFYRETDGVFNILVGDVLHSRGYDASYSLQSSQRDGVIGNPLTDIIETSTGWRLQRGQIDLGGIGKGFAIDSIAHILQNADINEYLINGGGDIYATSENGAPITLYLEHPTKPETYIGTTTIFNQGFAASSPHKRKWITSRGDTNHVVGRENILDASFVIAPNALTADVLATTALLLPITHSMELVEKHTAALAVYDADTETYTGTVNFPFNPL